MGFQITQLIQQGIIGVFTLIATEQMTEHSYNTYIMYNDYRTPANVHVISIID